MMKTKAEKGITLVALIITIIVLLILAVVAINAVQNDGIIEYAKNARDEYEKAQDKEEATIEHLLGQIETDIGNGIVHNGLIPEGAIYKTSEGTVLTEFPKEVKDGDIYQYGDYEYYYNGWYKIAESTWIEDETIDGWGVKLIVEDKNQNGEIDERATIKSLGEILTTINGLNVRSLKSTFAYCTNLETSPKIPKNVSNMQNTFYECTSLAYSPEIPAEVISLSGTFYKCESLTKAPIIPVKVENMHSTFSCCYSLQAAPVIPSSVIKMDATFQDCYNLSGDIVINCITLESYNNCLTRAGCKLDENYNVIGEPNEITLFGANEEIVDGKKVYSNQTVLNYLLETVGGMNTKVKINE